MPDLYAEVKIEVVTPGAELEGVTYDQWVTISRGGVRLELFDMDCICPESLVETTQRVKIGVMSTRIVPSRSETTSMNKNTFIAKARAAPAPMVSRPYLWQSSLALQIAARSPTPQSEPKVPRVSYSGPPYRASTLYGVSSSTSFLQATAQA